MASPNSVSFLISIANPGVAGFLVCFVVRAICLSPCMTIHHSEGANDQGNCAWPAKIMPMERRWRRALRRRRPGWSLRYSDAGADCLLSRMSGKLHRALGSNGITTPERSFLLVHFLLGTAS